MARLIQAVAKYGPKVERGRMAGIDQVSELVAKGTGLSDGQVNLVLRELHNAILFYNRTGVPVQLLNLCRKEGYALVSFDYRLAPEVKLPAIIEDVEDGFRWLRDEAENAIDSQGRVRALVHELEL